MTAPMKEVAAFLLGEAPLEGLWLGERHPAGAFWWREHLRAALAAPATAPEFNPDWARMIHYPECWDTAAYPELSDAIHEVLAWSGCSACKPATAPSCTEECKTCVGTGAVNTGGFDWDAEFGPCPDCSTTAPAAATPWPKEIQPDGSVNGVDPTDMQSPSRQNAPLVLTGGRQVGMNTLREALKLLHTLLNGRLNATQMLAAEKEAREWLDSIGSEPS